jgi:site-specific DNA-cytosine methylase
MVDITTLSCFSGIGGAELACEAVGGFEVTDAIEKHPYRQQVLKKNFPHLNIHDDICTFKPQNPYQLVISTFPCKGMSLAGKGLGYNNQHSALWWESYRLIKECNPQFVVIENVRGFLLRGARECIDGLRMAGYAVETPAIISAKEVGAIHQRERVFIVAYRLPPGFTTDPHGLKWRGELQPSWAGQIRSQIAAVRGEDFATDSSSLGLPAQFQPPGLPRGSCVEEEKPQQARTERAWLEPRRSPVPCGTIDSRWPQFRPFDQRVPDGLPPQLHEYCRGGWWLNNPFYGSISAPRKSIKDRQKRISALGDACTPQQMAIPLMRVKFLNQLFQAAERSY